MVGVWEVRNDAHLPFISNTLFLTHTHTFFFFSLNHFLISSPLWAQTPVTAFNMIGGDFRDAVEHLRFFKMTSCSSLGTDFCSFKARGADVVDQDDAL